MLLMLLSAAGSWLLHIIWNHGLPSCLAPSHWSFHSPSLVILLDSVPPFITKMFVPSPGQGKSLIFFFYIVFLSSYALLCHNSTTATINGISLMPPHTDNASTIALLSNVVITTSSDQHTPVKCLTRENSAKANRMLVPWVANQVDWKPHPMLLKGNVTL